jgi:hypothetical protein
MYDVSRLKSAVKFDVVAGRPATGVPTSDEYCSGLVMLGTDNQPL